MVSFLPPQLALHSPIIRTCLHESHEAMALLIDGACREPPLWVHVRVVLDDNP